MRIRNKKLATAVAGLAAVGVIGIGSVAYALFASDSSADAAGGAETVSSVIVSGEQLKTPLLPTETSNVQLTISNPNSNVRATITDIEANGVTVTAGSIDEADVDTCKNAVVLSDTNTLNKPFPMIAKSGEVKYTLVDAVTLADSAPIECQGMAWTTSWRVSFQAVR